MLTATQLDALHNLIGHALDQAHDAPEGEAEYLDTFDTTASELDSIARELSKITVMPAESYIRAARDLAENLPDSLPADITTQADADNVLREFKQHAESLEQARALEARRWKTQRYWIVSAPWDGPELELEPMPHASSEPTPTLNRTRAELVLEQLSSYVATEPNDAEQMLARLMLAAGALYARGAGTLTQCMYTAGVWERG
jgi:hypothetical protein